MLALLIRLGVPPWFLRVTALIAASVVGLACGTNVSIAQPHASNVAAVDTECNVLIVEMLR